MLDGEDVVAFRADGKKLACDVGLEVCKDTDVEAEACENDFLTSVSAVGGRPGSR